MQNKFQDFLALHNQPEPLLIGNVWNAQSAKIFERQNFKAIGTSSAAVAESLGYADGEEMSLDEYLFIIKNISAAVSIPLSVDIEFGYGDTPEEISKVITRLYDMGVSGINIEDSVVVAGKRSIVDAAVFTEKLRRIISLLDVKLFINVRSDSFLLGLPNALEDALARIELYQHTGVHGLFLPCITRMADIEKVTTHSMLPINVMCMPGLPDFKHLQQVGVKRISMGPFLYNSIYQKMEESVKEIVTKGSFEYLF
jgi:2-methylisocitrate lyase-like PEP mutase family enzyme